MGKSSAKKSRRKQTTKGSRNGSATTAQNANSTTNTLTSTSPPLSMSTASRSSPTNSWGSSDKQSSISTPNGWSQIPIIQSLLSPKVVDREAACLMLEQCFELDSPIENIEGDIENVDIQSRSMGDKVNRNGNDNGNSHRTSHGNPSVQANDAKKGSSRDQDREMSVRQKRGTQDLNRLVAAGLFNALFPRISDTHPGTRLHACLALQNMLLMSQLEEFKTQLLEKDVLSFLAKALTSAADHEKKICKALSNAATTSSSSATKTVSASASASASASEAANSNASSILPKQNGQNAELVQDANAQLAALGCIDLLCSGDRTKAILRCRMPDVLEAVLQSGLSDQGLDLENRATTALSILHTLTEFDPPKAVCHRLSDHSVLTTLDGFAKFSTSSFTRRMIAGLIILNISIASSSAQTNNESVHTVLHAFEAVCDRSSSTFPLEISTLNSLQSMYEGMRQEQHNNTEKAKYGGATSASSPTTSASNWSSSSSSASLDTATATGTGTNADTGTGTGTDAYEVVSAWLDRMNALRLFFEAIVSMNSQLQDKCQSQDNPSKANGNNQAAVTNRLKNMICMLHPTAGRNTSVSNNIYFILQASANIYESRLYEKLDGEIMDTINELLDAVLSSFEILVEQLDGPGIASVSPETMKHVWNIFKDLSNAICISNETVGLHSQTDHVSRGIIPSSSSSSSTSLHVMERETNVALSSSSILRSFFESHGSAIQFVGELQALDAISRIAKSALLPEEVRCAAIHLLAALGSREDAPNDLITNCSISILSTVINQYEALLSSSSPSSSRSSSEQHHFSGVQGLAVTSTATLSILVESCEALVDIFSNDQHDDKLVYLGVIPALHSLLSSIMSSHNESTIHARPPQKATLAKLSGDDMQERVQQIQEVVYGFVEYKRNQGVTI